MQTGTKENYSVTLWTGKKKKNVHAFIPLKQGRDSYVIFVYSQNTKFTQTNIFATPYISVHRTGTFLYVLNSRLLPHKNVLLL